MATVVVCHGAWGGGWAWRRVRAPLRAKGHELFTPTYTGLGDRFRSTSPSVGLSTHIDDIVATLFHEDLTDVVLIGHSYGGMVATGVADRARPSGSGRSSISTLSCPPTVRACSTFMRRSRSSACARSSQVHGAGWLMPPSPLAPDLLPGTAAWLKARRMPQPLKTFEEPIRLTGAAGALPRSYIYCTQKNPDDVFAPIAARLRGSGLATIARSIQATRRMPARRTGSPI